MASFWKFLRRWWIAIVTALSIAGSLASVYALPREVWDWADSVVQGGTGFLSRSEVQITVALAAAFVSGAFAMHLWQRAGKSQSARIYAMKVELNIHSQRLKDALRTDNVNASLIHINEAYCFDLKKMNIVVPAFPKDWDHYTVAFAMQTYLEAIVPFLKKERITEARRRAFAFAQAIVREHATCAKAAKEERDKARSGRGFGGY